MRPAYFLTAFILIIFVEMIGFSAKKKVLYYLTKPLLIPSLLGYYFVSVSDPHLTIIAALSFGWIGDILLLLPASRTRRAPLTAGILMFLFGHMCYILFFLLHTADPASIPPYGLILLAAVGILGVLIYIRLWPYIQDLKTAVAVYTISLTLMIMGTLLGMGQLRIMVTLLFFSGGLLFAVSDTANGYSRLVHPYRGSDILIMSTYLAAQLSIVIGVVLIEG
ncbi:MAG: lysoplasmalogenase [Spirochaetia bacterium]|nr:lysoplasmalogenase [Spirochaetia bacterium]